MPLSSGNSEKKERYARPISELLEMWKPRVKFRTYLFSYATVEDMEKVMNSLTSYDREKWAAAFSEVAKQYEEKAVQADTQGDTQGAKEKFLSTEKWARETELSLTSDCQEEV